MPGSTANLISPVRLSATGLTRLGECEARWLWKRDADQPEEAKGRALRLGTAVHAGVEARLLRQDWRAALAKLAEETPGWTPEFQLPDPLPAATWLMERHEEVYPTLPEAVATELSFELPLPGPVPAVVVGRMDGLVRDDFGLWVYETKTMSKWDRLNWLDIDPQLGIYQWAAREMGYEIEGVIYDAILTTTWKTEAGEVYKTGPRKGQPKGFHPASDSFRQLTIPLRPAHVAATLDTLRAAAVRAAEITAIPSRAVKSTGRNCGWCPAFDSCHPYANR